MTEHPETAVRLQRTIPAPPARVYRAWLDPQVMCRWFAPAMFTVGKAEVDERVGGRFRLWHQDADGNDVGGAEATIEELVPTERIVLSWHFVWSDRSADPTLESRLTITFAPTADGATLLDLTHEHLGGMRARMPEVADNVAAGWDGTLGILADVMSPLPEA